MAEGGGAAGVEERRQSPAGQAHWSERWAFNWNAPDGTSGGCVTLVLEPDRGAARYRAAVIRAGRPLLTVIETDVPLPGAGLEIRAPGLWADHVVEVPLSHMSLSLEAFGLELDSASEALGHEPRGYLTPLGFELDWESEPDDREPWGEAGAYRLPCAVHGVLLVGDARIELDCWGWRDHRWGGGGPSAPDATSTSAIPAAVGTPNAVDATEAVDPASALEAVDAGGDGEAPDALQGTDVGPPGASVTGHWSDGRPFSAPESLAVVRSGFPSRGVVPTPAGGLTWAATGIAPMPLGAPDRPRWLTSALARFRGPNASEGAGWIEWEGASPPSAGPAGGG